MNIVKFPTNKQPPLSIDDIAEQAGAESITIHYRVGTGYLVGINFHRAPSAVGHGKTFKDAVRSARSKLR